MGKHKSSQKKNKRKHYSTHRSSSSSETAKNRNRKKVKIETEQSNNVDVARSSKTATNCVNCNEPITVTGDEHQSNERRDLCDTSKHDMYGPALPLALINRVYGNNSSKIISEENSSDGNDEDVIGPLPPSVDGNINPIQFQLDQRAEALNSQFKNKKEKVEEVNARESWMLELPAEKSAAFGLNARKFKVHNSGDKNNRSLWTETPNSESSTPKEVEVDLQNEQFRDMYRQQRDEAMEKMIKNCPEVRSDKSLLEIHRENMNKTKLAEDKKRRPFDRNTDLQSNRFDEAQKKSIIKKAQLLDSRFSKGQAKYL